MGEMIHHKPYTKPLISVVMPVYNTERYLPKAIESILQQTCRDFEFIIIDDGSTDQAYSIAQTYAAKDNRIKLLKNQHNIGLPNTLNRGLDLAIGKYIARMDSDDISLPDRFRIQIEHLEKHPSIVVLGTQYEVIDENDYPIKKSHNPTSPGELRWSLFFQSPITAVMMNASVLNQHKFRYNDVDCEDYELWVRIAEFFPIANIPQVAYLYRMHQSNITSKTRRNRDLVFGAIIVKAIKQNIDIEIEANQVLGLLASKRISNISDAMFISSLVVRLERVTHKWDISTIDRNAIRRSASAKLRAIWRTQNRSPLMLPYVLYAIAMNPSLPGEWIKEITYR